MAKNLTKRKLYTTEEMESSFEIVHDRIMSILDKLSPVDAELLMYAFKPRFTSPYGAYLYGQRYNADEVLHQALYNNFDIETLCYDGNSGYTLMSIAQAVQDGDF